MRTARRAGRRRLSGAVAAALLAAGLWSTAGLPAAAAPAPAADPPAATCENTIALANGNFEQPVIGNSTSRNFPATEVPGWHTTDPRNQIRIMSNGYLGVHTPAGRQYAALNASAPAMLYQDVATRPGETLGWTVRHRAHSGTDRMRVVIGAPGGPLTQSGPVLSDGAATWGTHTGNYVVPAGQTVTRFGVEALSGTAGSLSNLVDDVSFGTPACLAATKTVQNLTRSAPEAEVGDVLRYTVTVASRGGNPARSVSSADVLEPGLTFVPGSLRIVSGPGAGSLTDAAGDDQGEYVASERTVRVRLGAFASATAGGSLSVGDGTVYSFDARVNASAGSAVENSATLTYNDPAFARAHTSETAPARTPVNDAADLAITKTLATSPAVAGEPVDYTITASNNGPRAGTGVRVVDDLPAGIGDVTATTPDGTCSVASGTVRCDLADIPVGGRTVISLSGTLSPSLDPGAALVNTAAVSGSRTDPDPANNTATASTTVTTSADVSITKTFTPGRPAAGEAVTYTLTAHNAGPSDARDVRITDPLDPNVRLDAAAVSQGTCTAPGTVVTCTVGTLAPGRTATATVEVTLASGSTAVVQNSASVTTSTSDPHPENNVASASIEPELKSDLSLTKTADRSQTAAGDTVVFSLHVVNGGPSDASDVVLDDTLPAGFAVAEISAPSDAVCGNSGPAVRCEWEKLDADAEATVTVTTTVAADAPAGTVTNTASVVSPADDPNTENNSGSVAVEVVQSADLSVAKSAVPATGVPGTAQAYEITVRNAGPSTARGVVVRDPLPADLLEAASPTPGCAILSGVLVCDLGDVARGGSAVARVSGTWRPTATGTVENTATVSSATPDPRPGDDSATVAVRLTPEAALSVSKTTSTPHVLLGQSISYTVTVRNAGPSAAAGVTLQDATGAGILLDSGTVTAGTWFPADASWSLGTLLPGRSERLTLTGTAEQPGTVTNTVTLSSPTPGSAAGDLTATAIVRVSPAADLSLVKSAPGGAEAHTNGPVDYLLTVRNHGPSPAADVTVSDTLPAGLIRATTPTRGCAIAGTALTCRWDALAAGATRTIRVSAVIDPASPATSITNTARATSTTADPDPANNTSAVRIRVTGTPRVALVKTASAVIDADRDGRADAGDVVTYTFTVRNTGQTILTDVAITDPMLGGAVACAPLVGATLAPGRSVTCAAVGHTITAAEAASGTLSNTATVTADSPRGPARASASATVTLGAGEAELPATGQRPAGIPLGLALLAGGLVLAIVGRRRSVRRRVTRHPPGV